MCKTQPNDLFALRDGAPGVTNKKLHAEFLILEGVCLFRGNVSNMFNVCLKKVNVMISSKK